MFFQTAGMGSDSLPLKAGNRVQVTFAAGLQVPYVTRISGIVGMGASEPLFYNPDPAGDEGYGVVPDVLFLPPASVAAVAGKPIPGQIRVTNNLSKKLDNAKMLFIFLTLPGVALGAYLSKYATELASGPLRRDISQLRVRGAAQKASKVSGRDGNSSGSRRCHTSCGKR
ncbi:hypothetical protein [Deinococcus aquatilis]|uniref:hypothetical protein n=1 Tax=Deinococcus aquatilis TaxID=519440 RepID=UPI000A062C91|nr:hypothetical protein [Deinococcus aquatilis]